MEEELSNNIVISDTHRTNNGEEHETERDQDLSHRQGIQSEELDALNLNHEYANITTKTFSANDHHNLTQEEPSNNQQHNNALEDGDKRVDEQGNSQIDELENKSVNQTNREDILNTISNDHVEPVLAKRENPIDAPETKLAKNPSSSLNGNNQSDDTNELGYLGKELHRCAESIIYYNDSPFDGHSFGPCIIKHRMPKQYRIKEIEKNLSTSRLRQEVSNLTRARTLGVPVPAIYAVNNKHKFICMEFLKDHVTIKDYLLSKADKTDEATVNDIKAVFRQLGVHLAELHNGNIIHGDLTSSNVMVDASTGKLRLIDFGLSSISVNIEDKAVDLYVFEKSLQCDQSEGDRVSDLVEIFYTGYITKSDKLDAVINRLQKVKLRGRKKIAFG